MLRSAHGTAKKGEIDPNRVHNACFDMNEHHRKRKLFQFHSSLRVCICSFQSNALSVFGKIVVEA
jgi:hypothetical protein